MGGVSSVWGFSLRNELLVGDWRRVLRLVEGVSLSSAVLSSVADDSDAVVDDDASRSNSCDVTLASSVDADEELSASSR